MAIGMDDLLHGAVNKDCYAGLMKPMSGSLY